MSGKAFSGLLNLLTLLLLTESLDTSDFAAYVRLTVAWGLPLVFFRPMGKAFVNASASCGGFFSRLSLWSLYTRYVYFSTSVLFFLCPLLCLPIAYILDLSESAICFALFCYSKALLTNVYVYIESVCFSTRQQQVIITGNILASCSQFCAALACVYTKSLNTFLIASVVFQIPVITMASFSLYKRSGGLAVNYSFYKRLINREKTTEIFHIHAKPLLLASSSAYFQQSVINVLVTSEKFIDSMKMIVVCRKLFDMSNKFFVSLSHQFINELVAAFKSEKRSFIFQKIFLARLAVALIVTVVCLFYSVYSYGFNFSIEKALLVFIFTMVFMVRFFLNVGDSLCVAYEPQALYVSIISSFLLMPAFIFVYDFSDNVLVWFSYLNMTYLVISALHFRRLCAKYCLLYEKKYFDIIALISISYTILILSYYH